MGFKTYRLCIIGQNSQSSRSDDVTPFKAVPQLLQSIICINVAYILRGLNVSPEIQNTDRIEIQNLRQSYARYLHRYCSESIMLLIYLWPSAVSLVFRDYFHHTDRQEGLPFSSKLIFDLKKK